MTLSAKARSALAGHLRRDVEGDILFDDFSRGRYATDTSSYQSFPAGVVVPKTQAGVVAAMREGTDVNTDGLLPDGLDFSTVGESPTRTVYVSKVSDTAEAGLELLDTYEGPSATSYTFG